MIRRDPLRTVYDALDRAGCQPRGPEHKFTARCPAHDDRDPSLSVSIGADGRALVYCFAGCQTAEIVAELGLSWCDLFPIGHHHARPLRGLAKPIRLVNLVLGALVELHIPYRVACAPWPSLQGMWVAELCPLCKRSDRWPLFITEDDQGRITLSCAGGCDQIDVIFALMRAETVTG
jgi:hypothetical protein